MLDGPTLVGVDISESAVAVCQLAELAGQHRLVRFGHAPLPPQAVVDGCVLDRAAVAQVLLELFAEQRVEERRVAVSVFGSSVIVKSVVLPQMSSVELSEQLQWEMELYVPFDIRDVSCGFEVLRSCPERGTMEVLLAAAKLEAVQSLLAVCREAELAPRLVTAPALCLRRVYEASCGAAEDAAETVALIDVGATATTIAILASGVPRLTRGVPHGARGITEKIQAALGVSLEQAELLVRGESASGSPPANEAGPLVEEMSEDLAAAIQRVLDFHGGTSEDPPIARLLLSGEAGELPAVVRAVGRRSGIAVDRLAGSWDLPVDSAHVAAELWARHRDRGALAVGLALHGRRPRRSTVNLLPGASSRGPGAGPDWLWEALDAVPLPEGRRQQVAGAFGASQGSLRKVAGAIKEGVDALPGLLQGLRATVVAAKPPAQPGPSPAASRQLLHELRVLAALVDAGLPLLHCIDTLLEVVEDEARRAVWRDVSERITIGASFGDALRAQPAAFDSFTVSMVAAGEVAGILDTILERLCDRAVLRELHRCERALRSAPDLAAAAAPWLSAGRCCWLLGLPLAAGVPILDSLDMVAEQMDEAWAAALRQARHEVSCGHSMYEPLQKTRAATGCPAAIIALVRAGEQTGALDMMLGRGVRLCQSVVIEMADEASAR